MPIDLNVLIKIATWMASPIGIFSCTVLLFLILALLQKLPRFRTGLLLVSCLQLMFFSLPFVSAWLHKSLETQAIRIAANKKAGTSYSAILLLGGTGISLSADQAAKLGKSEFGDGVDRIIHAADLFHKGIAPLIIISGGNWDTSDASRPSEAYSIRLLLMQLGVPADKIMVEERSRTTRENFLYTDALLKQHNLTGPIALVTSATHIPRAIRNATALKISADAFPTDWRSYGLSSQPLPWLPNAYALGQSEVALKEILANLVGY